MLYREFFLDGDMAFRYGFLGESYTESVAPGYDGAIARSTDPLEMTGTEIAADAVLLRHILMCSLGVIESHVVIARYVIPTSPSLINSRRYVIAQLGAYIKSRIGGEKRLHMDTVRYWSAGRRGRLKPLREWANALKLSYYRAHKYHRQGIDILDYWHRRAIAKADAVLAERNRLSIN